MALGLGWSRMARFERGRRMPDPFLEDLVAERSPHKLTARDRSQARKRLLRRSSKLQLSAVAKSVGGADAQRRDHQHMSSNLPLSLLLGKSEDIQRCRSLRIKGGTNVAH